MARGGSGYLHYPRGKSGKFSVSGVDIYIDDDEVFKVLKSLRGVEQELRREYSGTLRKHALLAADELLHVLKRSAPSRQARAAMRTARTKRDRVPAVTIGGEFRSPRSSNDQPQARILLHGSDTGGRNFPGARPWVAQTVLGFERNEAYQQFLGAVVEIGRKTGVPF